MWVNVSALNAVMVWWLANDDEWSPLALHLYRVVVKGNRPVPYASHGGESRGLYTGHLMSTHILHAVTII